MSNLTLQQGGLPGDFTADQIALIKNTIAKGTTDDELKYFLHVCRVTGLDPLAKQIHCVKRRDSKTGKDIASFQTSIDGFRLIAERSKKYAGQVGPQWCGDDGLWKDVWLDKKPPRAARVGVIRSDFDQTLYAIANWDSYVQSYNGKPGHMWAKMPELMLGKCAEALALRKAFPQDLSGLYTDDEINDEPTNSLNHRQSAQAHIVEVVRPNIESTPERDAIVKELESVANNGSEALRLAWNKLGEAKRKLVGAVEIERLKKLSETPSPTPTEEPKESAND